MIAVLGPALIIIGAFWLKPLLRPFFTVHSPPHQVLPAQHKTDIRFDQGIRLAGYDLGQSVVAPGDYLPVVLYWETDSAPLRLNLQPFVHLDRLNDSTTVAEATNYTPGDVTTESNMPTFHWDNARYVRDEHDLIVPAGTAPMAYAVRVGLLDPDQDGRLLPLSDGSGDTARLTIVNVAPGRRQPSRLDHRLAISLRNERDTIELTGFQVDSVIPNRLDFRLAWRSERRPQQNYTVFAQLLDSDQNLAASFDRPPLDGAYPTSTWLPGRTIIDRRYIPITGVRPGSYRLIVGLYDTQTGQRLITATGANFVELTTIEIEKR